MISRQSGLPPKADGKPRLLDLFSCAGGAARGYQEAGFYVVGVDINPQPNYAGDEFYQADALTFPLDGFDAIHASPPCQANIKGLRAVNMALDRTDDHVDLIGPIRERLQATGLPYAIENVEGATLHNPVRLCGSSFNLPLRRHRLFECNFPVMVPACNHWWQTERKYWTSWRPNGEHRLASVVQVYGNAGDSSQWAEAMEIDWMTRDEMREAIPPAYARHIGEYMLNSVEAMAV